MALYEKAIALDIGTTGIKGVSFRYSLGELQLFECFHQNYEDFQAARAPGGGEDGENAPPADKDSNAKSGKGKAATREAEAGEAGGDEPSGGEDEEPGAELWAANPSEGDPEVATDEEAPEVEHAESFIGQILEEFIERHWSLHHTFLINLPTEAVIIRDIAVPFHDPKKVLEVLPFELENLINVPLDSSVLETSIWGVEEEGNGQALAFCVPEQKLVDRAEFFILNQLDLRSICADNIGLHRLLTDGQERGENAGVRLQLDIGGQVSVLNLVRDQELIFTRVLNLGGEDFTLVIQDELNKTRAEAEEIKLKLDVNLVDEKDKTVTDKLKGLKISRAKYKTIFKGFQELAGEFISEIRLSLAARKVSGELEKIYFSGGGSRVTGLVDYFGEHFVRDGDMPLEIGGYDNIEGFPEPSTLDLYASALGMVYHHTLTRQRKIDFLKGSFQSLFKRRSQWKLFKTPLLILGTALSLILVSTILGMMADKNNLEKGEKEMAKIYKDYFKASPDPAGGSPVEQAKDKVTNLKKTGFSNPTKNSVKVLQTLKEITDAMPGQEMEFEFQYAYFKNKDIRLTGLVADYSAASKLKVILDKSKKFKEVQLGSKKQVGSKVNAGKIQVTYKITPKTE